MKEHLAAAGSPPADAGGSDDDFMSQVCSSIVLSAHVPLSNCQSFSTAFISTSRPPTRFPSRSVTIESTSILSPFWTNVRGVLMPTYSDDGCTSSDVCPAQVCRLTSCTDADAEMAYGRGGLTDLKSTFSRCLPLASVRPLKVCVVLLPYGLPP